MQNSVFQDENSKDNTKVVNWNYFGRLIVKLFWLFTLHEVSTSVNFKQTKNHYMTMQDWGSVSDHEVKTIQRTELKTVHKSETNTDNF